MILLRLRFALWAFTHMRSIQALRAELRRMAAYRNQHGRPTLDAERAGRLLSHLGDTPR